MVFLVWFASPHIEPLLYEEASIFSMPCPRSSHHSMSGGSIEEGSPHLSEELCPELNLGSMKLDVGKIEPSTVMSWDERRPVFLAAPSIGEFPSLRAARQGSNRSCFKHYNSHSFY